MSEGYQKLNLSPDVEVILQKLDNLFHECMKKHIGEPQAFLLGEETWELFKQEGLAPGWYKGIPLRQSDNEGVDYFPPKEVYYPYKAPLKSCDDPIGIKTMWEEDYDPVQIEFKVRIPGKNPIKSTFAIQHNLRDTPYFPEYVKKVVTNVGHQLENFLKENTSKWTKTPQWSK